MPTVTVTGPVGKLKKVGNSYFVTVSVVEPGNNEAYPVDVEKDVPTVVSEGVADALTHAGITYS